MKQRFIDLEISTATKPISWWQEPSFVVGGIVVSASIASITTFILMKSK